MTENPSSKELDQKYQPVKKRLRDLFFRANLTLLTITPVLVAIMVPAILASIVNVDGSSPIPKPFFWLLGPLMAFIASLSGLVWIIRREVPGKKKIRGDWAEVHGFFWMVICIATGFLILILGLLDI